MQIHTAASSSMSSFSDTSANGEYGNGSDSECSDDGGVSLVDDHYHPQLYNQPNHSCSLCSDGTGAADTAGNGGGAGLSSGGGTTANLHKKKNTGVAAKKKKRMLAGVSADVVASAAASLGVLPANIGHGTNGGTASSANGSVGNVGLGGTGIGNMPMTSTVGLGLSMGGMMSTGIGSILGQSGIGGKTASGSNGPVKPPKGIVASALMNYGVPNPLAAMASSIPSAIAGPKKGMGGINGGSVGGGGLTTSGGSPTKKAFDFSKYMNSSTNSLVETETDNSDAAEYRRDDENRSSVGGKMSGLFSDLNQEIDLSKVDGLDEDAKVDEGVDYAYIEFQKELMNMPELFDDAELLKIEERERGLPPGAQSTPKPIQEGPSSTAQPNSAEPVQTSAKKIEFVNPPPPPMPASAKFQQQQQGGHPPPPQHYQHHLHQHPPYAPNQHHGPPMHHGYYQPHYSHAHPPPPSQPGHHPQRPQPPPHSHQHPIPNENLPHQHVYHSHPPPPPHHYSSPSPQQGPPHTHPHPHPYPPHAYPQHYPQYPPQHPPPPQQGVPPNAVNPNAKQMKVNSMKKNPNANNGNENVPPNTPSPATTGPAGTNTTNNKQRQSQQQPQQSQQQQPPPKPKAVIDTFTKSSIPQRYRNSRFRSAVQRERAAGGLVAGRGNIGEKSSLLGGGSGNEFVCFFCEYEHLFAGPLFRKAARKGGSYKKTSGVD
jgi:hypothetical protein